MRSFFTCVIFFSQLYSFAHANLTDSANGTSSVNIVNPITVSEISPLSFGEIILADRGSNTIIMGNNGQLSSTAAAAQYNGSKTTGEFLITGSPHAMVFIQFNNSNDLNRGPHSIKLRGFTTENRKPVLNENGNVVINVGARIIINPNQPSGNYTGSYPITVSYQ